MNTAIVWFRNDLRVHDNEALFKATEKFDHVIPFYCFEEGLFQKTRFGFPKIATHRARFLIESVQNLKKNIQKLGSDLVVRTGNPVKHLIDLSKDSQAIAIFCHKEITAEEVEIEKQLAKLFEGEITYFYGAALYHPNDIPFKMEEIPTVFTPFRKKIEERSKVRACFPIPEKIKQLPSQIFIGQIPLLEDFGIEFVEKDTREVLPFQGGEDEAMLRLNHYFYESKELSLYKEKRNGLIGANYSSKLSVWLWNGCISPRRIYWEVKNYEQQVEANDSTYWLIFELIWRDYFKYIAIKYGNRIFHKKGIQNQVYQYKDNRDFVKAWTTGQTGVPFIDANMRELNATGFMSNRGRQNVASFLVKELQLDWRIGAEYFESMLLDYDVCSNYGNWMYIAGVGNDSRDRYFNIILQAKNYDPDGEYVKLWISELVELEKKVVHHPWTTQNTLFNQVEGVEYPKMVIPPPTYWEKHY